MEVVHNILVSHCLFIIFWIKFLTFENLREISSADINTAIANAKVKVNIFLPQHFATICCYFCDVPCSVIWIIKVIYRYICLYLYSIRCSHFINSHEVRASGELTVRFSVQAHNVVFKYEESCQQLDFQNEFICFYFPA